MIDSWPHRHQAIIWTNMTHCYQTTTIFLRKWFKCFCLGLSLLIGDLDSIYTGFNFQCLIFIVLISLGWAIRLGFTLGHLKLFDLCLVGDGDQSVGRLVGYLHPVNRNWARILLKFGGIFAISLSQSNLIGLRVHNEHGHNKGIRHSLLNFFHSIYRHVLDVIWTTFGYTRN